MNVFSRKGRKAKEHTQTEGNPRPALQTNQSSFARSLKRKQKAVPETKPELDFTLTLPDTEDFRTSLLLPGLSARFSMLREQDDPSTKVGKANDDSVLFPSRISRLNLFSHNPLTEIVEVNSLYSIRPPFATQERSMSVSEGYASDDGGSLMSRAKPIESNILFSGRQKMYRIPTDSDSTGVGDRHVYQNDVSAAAFTGSSLSEEQSSSHFEHPEGAAFAEGGDVGNANPPSTPVSKNRGTTSSTTSAPSNGRASTAATSVASESPAIRQSSSTSGTTPLSRKSGESDPSLNGNSVPKRLFGPNPELSSPLLPTVQDVLDTAGQSRTPSRAKSPFRLSHSRSATNLSDRYAQHRSVVISAGSSAKSARSTISPVKTKKDVAIREETRSPGPSFSATFSTPALAGEAETATSYNDNVQPSDRGKATALGLFNRPQHQYDDTQFSQRQVQMHEGRNSPLASRSESRRASPEPEMTSQNESIEAPKPVDNEPPPPVLQSGTGRSGKISPTQGSRSSKASSARSTSGRARKQSSASTAASALVRARAETLIREENAKLASLEVSRSFYKDVTSPVAPPVSTSSTDADGEAHGTFFDALDGSEDEADATPLETARQSISSRKMAAGISPTLHDGLSDFDFGTIRGSPQLNLPLRSLDDSNVSHKEASISNEQILLTPIPSPCEEKSADSPTLPVSGLALSGLVRTHLRHDSDKSSLYPQPSPALSQTPSSYFSQAPSVADTEQTIGPPESTRSDPWELDKAMAKQDSPRKHFKPQDAASAMSQRAQQMLSQAAAIKQLAQEAAKQKSAGDNPETGDLEPPRSWEGDGKASHRRGSSTLTQKERRDFDDKTAAARRKIQQNLKNSANGDSRPASPAGRYEAVPSGVPSMPTHLMQDPRYRTPGQSLEDQTYQPKAMKMLGIQGPTRRKASPRIPQDELWKEEEERMKQDFGWRPKQRLPPGDEEGQDRARGPLRPPPSRNGSADDERDRQITNSLNQSRRDRSGSEAEMRSRSRTGAPRDEDERQFRRVNAGSESRSQATSRSPPADPSYRAPSRGGPPDPRNNQSSASAISGRYRSNSRPANGPGHVDNRPPPPPTMPFGPPRPSPRPTLSQNSPMSPHPPQRPFDSSSSPAPSATNSPTMANYPLPSTGRTTPTSNGRTTPSLGTRKKSVTKNMISEPTFMSSTSSVPLVELPTHRPGTSPSVASAVESSDGSSPPVPVMNPKRRRGTATTAAAAAAPQNPSPFHFLRPEPKVQSKRDMTTSVPRSPDSQMSVNAGSADEHSHVTFSDDNAVRAPKPRNRLRKTSSEGGSMAAKVRNQVILGELKEERLNTPVMPNFSMASRNASGTNLKLPMQGVRPEGEMF